MPSELGNGILAWMNGIDDSKMNLESKKQIPASADDFVRADGKIYGAHWQIFMPTLVVSVLYVSGWFLLLVLGRSDGALAKMFILVLAVGVPFLAIQAFLRFNTTRIQVCETHIRYHPGWPKRFLVELPFELVERVWVKRGLSGWLYGGGTLIMKLTTGDKVVVPDLGDPEGARGAVEAVLKQPQY